MKKLLLVTAAAVIFALNANAQGPKGLSIGAGFVHNFYILNDQPDIKMDNSCYFGPYIEVGYDWNYKEMNGLYVGARYEFVHKYGGVGMYVPGGTAVAEAYTYRHYIDVPVKYRFTLKIDRLSSFFFDLGPTFNFMVGNVSYLNEFNPRFWSSQKIDWYKDAPDMYNWFNLSIGTNIGFFLDHAKLFVGYDYGGLLSYTNQDYYGRGQVHQLRIGAAYIF